MAEIIENSVNCPEAIPDNFAPGIDNSLTVNTRGAATAVYVSVDIVHPRSGDLSIKLLHPNGHQAIIQTQNNNNNNPQIPIVNFSVPAFKGWQMIGGWVLNVADHFPQNVGTLESWSVTIDY